MINKKIYKNRGECSMLDLDKMNDLLKDIKVRKGNGETTLKDTNDLIEMNERLIKWIERKIGF
jgi:hypothetical protein